MRALGLIHLGFGHTTSFNETLPNNWPVILRFTINRLLFILAISSCFLRSAWRVTVFVRRRIGADIVEAEKVVAMAWLLAGRLWLDCLLHNGGAAW